MKPDLCVIGAGVAGLSVASTAAALGASVVLVEHARMGGALVGGAVAALALRASAEAAEAFRRATPFGIAAAKPRVDWPRVRTHAEHVVGAAAGDLSEARCRALGVRVLRGEPRFVSPLTALLGDHTIQPRRFVLAVGSSPAAPDLPGLADTPFLTPEAVSDLPARPERLIVLGGEPVAVELAQALRRLGSEVAVAAPGRILERFDPELVAALAAALRREGVDIREIAPARGVSGGPDGVRVELQTGEVLTGSHLLVAAGRRVVTEGLDLDKAGVEADASGILVDRRLRTANKRVFAIGDCAGGPHAGDRCAHVAAHHAAVVIRNALFRWPARVETRALPLAVRTSPALATVGLSEAQALETRRAVRILRWPYAESDRARAERLTEGEIKVITDKSGVILGASIVGARADELITTWTLAVKKGLSVADLRDLVVPYPTFSEIGQRAAASFDAPRARSPWLRRAVALLRRLG
ncbi:dihydrolipoamide dehydrogenase [Alsobacter soli]|uniref:Dihydrolipoamide dehydrogenase n=1 Tax=Alsobacter soli TaxID=2109933 RepID=A0A2T1HXP7_9HYPH|nr:dihydrolipoamide dehydrogenase [Alsobacter soli]